MQKKRQTCLAFTNIVRNTSQSASQWIKADQAPRETRLAAGITNELMSIYDEETRSVTLTHHNSRPAQAGPTTGSNSPVRQSSPAPSPQPLRPCLRLTVTSDDVALRLSSYRFLTRVILCPFRQTPFLFTSTTVFLSRRTHRFWISF